MKSEDFEDDAAQRGVDELRALWSALPAPRAGAHSDGLPSADLADSDRVTQVAVERLRAAWAAHAVQVPELPFALRRAHAARATRAAADARRAHAAPRARRATAALGLASLAAAGLAVFALRSDRDQGGSEGTGGAAIASVGDLRPEFDDGAPRAVERSTVPNESAATLVEIPREDFTSRRDGFEFEAHGVRFVLIETTGEAR